MSYRLTGEQIKGVVENGSRLLAEHCIASNLHFVVTGSSGGTDSAVTLALAERARYLARNRGHDLTSVALILPCESDPEDTEKGLNVAIKFGAKIILQDLKLAFDSYMAEVAGPLNKTISKILGTSDSRAVREWDWSQRVAQGNVKARLRMITLYHTARILNGMVLSTDNLSEYWMAFWTICGDVGDFNIIQNIMKGRELYDIAYFLGVPERILTAKPGDGLKVGGTAEDQLGADYRTIDTIMVQLIQQGFDPNGSYNQLVNLPNLGINPLLVEKVARRCLGGTYKRRGTVTLSREELGLPAIKDIQLSGD